MTNFMLLLQNATFEYNRGNLSLAKKHLTQLFRNFEDTSLSNEHPLSIHYLNALTLAQSIATRTHDLTSYEFYEPKVKKWTLNLFENVGSSYHGLHLTDACETYLAAGDYAKARQVLLEGISVLEKENGSCPLINLIYYYHTAKLHFQMQQYYQCIDTALMANNCWLQKPIVPENASAFLQQCISNPSFISQIGCSNLVVLACAYGKINTPENGITILTTLLEEHIEDYYFKTSVEITLIELYLYSGEYTKARELYSKYKTMNISAYPDLCVSLRTFSHVLESSDTLSDSGIFIPEFDGQLSNSFCYSKDALQILLYNHGLKMIADGQYSAALTLYRQLENRGLSLQLHLLAKTGNYASIPHIKQQADRYYEQEIRNLFLYYNEKLVHNHLSLLETHFSLCMDSYIQCLEHLGSDVMPPEQIYDFLLNTKYISLEASYLSRYYQTLEKLNNRKAFISSDIQNCLLPDTALLEYCLIKTLDVCYYCVFIITADIVSCIPLAEQSVIDEQLSQWHSLLQTPIHATAYDPVMYEHAKSKADALLRRYLFRPIKDFILNKNISRLIVAPAGELIHFPFSCLPISSNSYLGTSFEITYVNTGKELITNPPVSTPCISSGLILGNPEFIHFTPLPYAEKEAKKIADILHLPCFTGKEATFSLFETYEIMAPSLLHFATHGVFEESVSDNFNKNYNTAYQFMENSGLILAEDALLSCNRIMTMNCSNTFLTVLSACQTGDGIFHRAEGIYGLRRAFRLAGCHSMILSLWQVDDYSGCLFMEYFYESLLKENYNAKKAFFQAVSMIKDYEEDGCNPFSHPYYWAGYLFME